MDNVIKKITVIPTGDKVTGTAIITMVCYLHSTMTEMLICRLVETKMNFCAHGPCG